MEPRAVSSVLDQHPRLARTELTGDALVGGYQADGITAFRARLSTLVMYL